MREQSPYRKDFPIFKNEYAPKGVCYLDSAATTLKPLPVIERINQFYMQETSNVGRGHHYYTEKNTQALEEVRELTAAFINASPHEIAFTQNASDALNIIAASLITSKEDEVIVSLFEHHSNFIPWQQRANVKVANINQEGIIDIDHLLSLITPKTKVIAITQLSNITGNEQPIEQIINYAKEKDILTVIDGTQAIKSLPVDMRKLGCDFYVFSSHKMLGPSGVGILYAAEPAQKHLTYQKFGGGMSNRVTIEHSEFKPFPFGFEIGTPNIEGILGFGAALDYIQHIGIDNIHSYLVEIEQYFRENLKKLDFIELISPLSKNHAPIFTIKAQGERLSMISKLLWDNYKIVIRDGYHCSQLFYNHDNLEGGIRASCYLYTNKQDIDTFLNALKDLELLFS